MSEAEIIRQTIIRLSNVEPGEPARLAFIECLKAMGAARIESIFYRGLLDPNFTSDLVIQTALDTAVGNLVENWRLVFEEYGTFVECGYDATVVMPIVENAIIKGAEERFAQLALSVGDGGSA